MHIRASLKNSAAVHEVTVDTDGRSSTLALPGRAEGGSAVNGGELLCAALATCYCNDVYREAARRGVSVRGVNVDVEAEFGGRGEPAYRITCAVSVESDAAPEEIEALLRETDTVAEVQNTVRAGLPVELRLVRSAQRTGG